MQRLQRLPIPFRLTGFVAPASRAGGTLEVRGTRAEPGSVDTDAGLRQPPIARRYRSTTETALIVGTTLVAISFPFLLVKFVPAIDLPQQLAQVRLFLETLGGAHRGTLVIRWLPNTLVYLVILVAWELFAPILAGKIAMLALALAWSGSSFALARGRGRPVEGAAIAALLVFNLNFYWGLMNFLIGWPCFVAWLILILKGEGEVPAARDLLLLSGCAVLLFLAHALWFLAGAGILLVFDLKGRVPVRVAARHLIAIAPIIIFSAFWFPQRSAVLAASGVDMRAFWGPCWPWKRHALLFLSDTLFGEIRGPATIIGAAGIIIWIAASVATQARSLATAVDRKLALTGALFLAFALVAPCSYAESAFFGARWVPVAATLLVLALPAPKMPRVLILSFPLLLVICFGFVTGRAWMTFDRQDLSGLREALRALPEQPRVLGLDFIKQSVVLKDRPFLQIFAYAQALHGGEVNFSFAETQGQIVGYSKPRRITWTRELQWYPELVSFDDFQKFDFALVNASEAQHRALQYEGVVTPLTSTGRWRAYRCVHYARTSGPEG
jgi:hypothetical protein